jgi:poly-gamma-glutamate synthesis protein (capsule biosynthesis protein)
MADKVVITAVGDIMPGDHPLYLGIGVRSVTEGEKIFVFEYVKKLLSGSNIIFGNLESVLSDRGKKECYDSLMLRGSPDFVEQLKNAGFNLLNIANNHIQQHGDEPFLDTIELLNKNGIGAVGSKDLQPKIFVFGDIRVTFCGYSLRPEQYADKTIYAKEDEDKILSDVIKIKGNVDYLIISLHWGDEYISFPSAEQIAFAHKLIDNGAGVIIGHHPHVLQGVEKYKGGIIAYSLGNFVSDMCQKKTKTTFILKLTLGRDAINYELIPCRINNNYQPVPLQGRGKNETLDVVEKLSDFSSFCQDEYRAAIENSISEFRKEYARFLVKNWSRYPVKYLIVIFREFIFRRLGIER